MLGGDDLRGIQRRRQGGPVVVGEIRPRGQAPDLQMLEQLEIEVAAVDGRQAVFSGHGGALPGTAGGCRQWAWESTLPQRQLALIAGPVRAKSAATFPPFPVFPPVPTRPP